MKFNVDIIPFWPTKRNGNGAQNRGLSQLQPRVFRWRSLIWLRLGGTLQALQHRGAVCIFGPILYVVFDYVPDVLHVMVFHLASLPVHIRQRGGRGQQHRRLLCRKVQHLHPDLSVITPRKLDGVIQDFVGRLGRQSCPEVFLFLGHFVKKCVLKLAYIHFVMSIFMAMTFRYDPRHQRE